MNEFLKIKHSFNAGDLIVLLPSFKYIYEKEGKKTVIYQRLNFGAFYYSGATSPIKDYDGNMVCMNESVFNMLKPLIESQEYIESFEVWNGQKFDIDIDLTRDSKWCPMPAGLIHHYAWSLYPQLSCDLSKKWLNFKTDYGNEDYSRCLNFIDKIIINRTSRYTNPYISYFFLKKYLDIIIFVGTDNEYEDFNNEWQIEIPRLEINDFLELGKILSVCKLFIGNQSMCWHIADSLKIQRILELCPQFPNTFPMGANGYGFYRQEALEYYVNKLLNE